MTSQPPSPVQPETPILEVAVPAEPKPGYLTTEFWLTVSASLIAFANTTFGWHIPTDELLTIIGVIASYVLSRGLAKRRR